ncbi:hypothetical protein [Streptacidiphilus neutrinimicus]|uniref:hypothetical protein n=1 Tax=Streptacidiphilus neutrinimicus TaxID=105420 RepID=UPI001269E786|nr:hypothetical protein [Streptacidiphilus neutrinimicus]
MVIGGRGWRALLAVALGVGGVIGPATTATGLVTAAPAAKKPAAVTGPVAAKRPGLAEKPAVAKKPAVAAKSPAVTKQHPAGRPRLFLAAEPLVALRPGGRAVVHEELWNLGDAPENAQVVLGVSLPPGVSVTSLPAGCIPQPQGHVADCLFPAGLKPDHADRVDIPVVSAKGVKPAVLTGQARGGTTTAAVSGNSTKFLLVVLH